MKDEAAPDRSRRTVRQEAALPMKNGGPVTPRRRPRRYPPLRLEFDWELFMNAQCYLLTFLHDCSGLDLAALAREARLKNSTLRDYESHKALNSASTPFLLCHALGYPPERLVVLTRRWLRLYIRAQQREHQKPRGWMPKMPWEQPACQNGHG